MFRVHNIKWYTNYESSLRISSNLDERREQIRYKKKFREWHFQQHADKSAEFRWIYLKCKIKLW